MNNIDTAAEIAGWTANFIVIFNFFFVSTGHIKGNGKIYNVATLIITLLYGFYSVENKLLPPTLLGIVYCFISIKTIYYLYNPQKTKHFTIPPKISIPLLSLGATMIIINDASLQNFIALAGSTAFLTSYFLVSSGRIKGDQLTFNSIHLIGGILYGIYAVIKKEYPPVIWWAEPVFWLEIILTTIALRKIRKLTRRC